MIHRATSAVVAVAIVCVGGAAVQALVVDGSLSDWGVTVADNDGSLFYGGINSDPGHTPSTSVSGFFAAIPGDIGYAGHSTEDQSDTAGHSAYVGPDYGGQDIRR